MPPPKSKVELYRHIIETFNTGVDLKTLPQPMVVVIEGGKHADGTTDLQEYCMTAIRKSSVVENVRMIMRVTTRSPKYSKGTSSPPMSATKALLLPTVSPLTKLLLAI